MLSSSKPLRGRNQQLPLTLVAQWTGKQKKWSVVMVNDCGNACSFPNTKLVSVTGDLRPGKVEFVFNQSAITIRVVVFSDDGGETNKFDGFTFSRLEQMNFDLN